MTLAPVVRSGDGALAAAWVEHARRVMVRRLSDDVAWALETSAAAGAGARLPEPPPLGPAVPQVQMRVEESGAGGSSDPGSASFIVDFSAPATVAAMFRQAIVAWWNPGEPLWRGLERLLLHVSAEWERQARKPDRILTRDRFRCLVPGCSSRRNLHVHHFTFRSAGGGNEPDNLGAACAAHHLRGIHAGRIRARGRAPDEILWELGVRPGKEPLIRVRGDVYMDAGSS
jgi:hypothetical protein